MYIARRSRAVPWWSSAGLSRASCLHAGVALWLGSACGACFWGMVLRTGQCQEWPALTGCPGIEG
jgi:hypothetical protein